MRATLGQVALLSPALSTFSPTPDIDDDQSELGIKFEDSRSYTELEVPSSGLNFDCGESDDGSLCIHPGTLSMAYDMMSSSGLYHNNRDPMFADDACPAPSRSTDDECATLPGIRCFIDRLVPSSTIPITVQSESMECGGVEAVNRSTTPLTSVGPTSVVSSAAEASSCHLGFDVIVDRLTDSCEFPDDFDVHPTGTPTPGSCPSFDELPEWPHAIHIGAADEYSGRFNVDENWLSSVSPSSLVSSPSDIPFVNLSSLGLLSVQPQWQLELQQSYGMKSINIVKSTKKMRKNSESSTSDARSSSSNSPPPPSASPTIPRRRREKSRTPHLWKFMRAMLEDSSCNPEYIRWENKSEGVFRIVPGQSKNVALLWGIKKHNPSMTFDKLSRSLRWCRKYGFLADLPKTGRYPKKLCFRFAKFALDWIPDPTFSIPSMPSATSA